MKVLILGGDGYLGWPTAMHLSAAGHDVAVVDSYFRRHACLDLDISMLIQAPTLDQRARRWKEKSGHHVAVHIGDATDYDFLKGVFQAVQPDAVIHYAEQPSAPYSMLGHKEAAFTLNNNLMTTLNVAHAVHEVAPGCHIIKLGTMGEYGTPNIDIEEGFITINHKGREDTFLFPRQAGSLYHTTKVQDTDLLYFYVRIWGLKVTDLMQGPVYGLFIDAMEEDDLLATHFNYDDVFGTVLNRFLVQVVTGVPLTVYGNGGQTRGYLNLKDTMQCVRLAVENPAKDGEMRIFNQFTETFSVNDLADRVVKAAADEGIKAKVQTLPNPRVEREEHYYNPAHRGLLELGLQPNLLTEGTLQEMIRAVKRHEGAIRQDQILPRNTWK